VTRGALALVWVLAAACARGPTVLDPPAATRLVVVAPHPDDETLAAGGLIQRVLSTGGSARVVVVTDGEGYREAAARLTDHPEPSADDYRALGRARMAELREAMRRLGVTDLVLLHAHDGSLADLSVAARDDLITRLGRAVRAAAPTLVVTADPRDHHPDHAAVARFTEAALVTGTPLLTYLVHDTVWPPPRPPDDTLPPPAGDEYAGTPWVSFTLRPEELATKRAALEAHGSQWPIIGGLLVRFLRRNEVFAQPSAAWIAASTRSGSERCW
jgi:LmbE family N-acetylglucosaminyl deacetylase